MSLQDEVKSFISKLSGLLYTPETNHPVLEGARELIVAELQAHLNSVTQAAKTMADNILQGLEQALQPPAVKK